MRAVHLVIFAVALGAIAAGAAMGDEPVWAPEQIDLFVGGTEGYHTYRIPALAVTADGTVLAFCEGRTYREYDWGKIDIVMKRSTDGGRTWGPLQVVQTDGRHTIGNPAPVVDRNTGRLWLPFCRNNSRVFVTWSDDGGVTWAPRREITGEVKPKGWTWYATGPGHGIQLRTGRLLIPCDHGEGRFAPLRTGVMHSHVIFSDDGGRTWERGGSLPGHTDECMSVERADGSVYLSIRNSLFPKRRAYAISRDGGETWSEPAAASGLVSPRCQASILALSGDASGPPAGMLFLNPASERRERMTLRRSTDDGESWSDGQLLHAGPSAYSDMVLVDRGTAGCLYERGERRYWEKITFARVPLGELSATEHRATP